VICGPRIVRVANLPAVVIPAAIRVALLAGAAVAWECLVVLGLACPVAEWEGPWAEARRVAGEEGPAGKVSHREALPLLCFILATPSTSWMAVNAPRSLATRRRATRPRKQSGRMAARG